MSGFLLSLYAFGGDLTGTPVVVDVLDQDLRLTAQGAVVVGSQYYFEVDAGRYGIQILLPSGRSVTDSVAVDEGPPVTHVMDLSEISPHESLQRTVVLKPTAFEALGNLDEVAYRSIWMRLWGRVEGIWSVQEWPRPEVSWDPDAVRYWFRTDRQQYMLQIGGPRIPWRMAALPAAERVEVCVRPSGSEAEPQLAMTVATDNNRAEALLGYLTIGAMDHAGLVNGSAGNLLLGGLADPAAAAVGGYYLLRTSDLARLHQWPRDLASWMRWMPDGAVIHAWQLIRQQQEAGEPSEAGLTASRDRLLEAVERGVPVYTEGLRLLVAGLKLLDFEADGRDREVRDALDRVRPFAATADLGQPTTTFTGSSPVSASASPIYGLPKSLKGLAFLYGVQLQDLINFGLVGAETSLTVGLFSQRPAEAQLTARGTIRLEDGREHTDPSKAVADAIFYDPWYGWSTPGGPTLGELRQQAREGFSSGRTPLP